VGQRFLRNVFGQALILLVITFVVGLTVNLARPTPVPFDGRRAFEMLPHISLEEAIKALDAGGSLFLDARPKEFYEQGRILNAMSLPLNSPDADVRRALPNPPPYDKVIIYCDDEDCDAADTMARRLKRMGYEKLWVLEGGWRAWSQANLPTN
jgi:rhodanese-related sulfurtransferase